MSATAHAPTRRHFVGAAIALLVLTVYGSIIPLRYDPVPLAEAVARVESAAWQSAEHSQARADWIVNRLQFALLGFLSAGALAIDRRASVTAVCAVIVGVAGWYLAFWLEVLQVSFPPRTISANDVFVERTGVIAGCTAWLLVGTTVVRWSRAFWNQAGLVGLARQLLPAWLVVLFVLNGMPFDFTWDPDQLRDKFERGAIQFEPWPSAEEGRLTSLAGSALNFLSLVPIGWMLGLIPWWANRPLRSTVLAGLLVAGGLETVQLLVASRYFKSLDIVLGTLAVAWGAHGIRRLDSQLVRGYPLLPQGIDVRIARFRQRVASWGTWPWLLGLAGWAALVIALSWQPFDFRTDPSFFRNSDPTLSDEHTPILGLRRMSFAPLVDYYYGSRYQALDQLVRRAASFAPLGIVGAVLFPHRRQAGWIVVLIFGLAVGTVIELGQYYIPERHPGVTDLCIHLLGAALAYGLAGHLLDTLDRG